MKKQNKNKRPTIKSFQKKGKKVKFKIENQKKTAVADLKALKEYAKNKNYRPEKLDRIEACVRKGEILQAIKWFREISGAPLKSAKEVIDTYRETGNWNHWTFTKNVNLLDIAFEKVCGANPETFQKNQDKGIYERAKAANTPIVSVNMALRIAIQYAQILHSDEIYRGTNNNVS